MKMRKLALYFAFLIAGSFLAGCASYVKIRDSAAPSVNKDNYSILAFDWPFSSVTVNGDKLGFTTNTLWGNAPDGKMYIYPPGRYTIEIVLKIEEGILVHTYSSSMVVDLEHGQHYFVNRYVEKNKTFVELVNETDPYSVWSNSALMLKNAENRHKYAKKAISRL
jgi:hypothetical protein